MKHGFCIELGENSRTEGGNGIGMDPFPQATGHSPL